MQLHNYFCCSCFLNPSTHFIWAFIAPVIVIILINVGFFIMAAVTIWRHHERKGGDTRTKHVKSWLKVLVSLVVVMGLTWVSGVPMAFDQWLPLAYIFTIMVAFQGMWIFFFFVLFQEQVRDTYIKSLRSTMGTLTKRKDNHRDKSKQTLSTGQDSALGGVMIMQNKSAS